MIYLLQHLLMNAAQKYPEKEAVIFQNESISYQELDTLTNQLANFLIERGVRAGDRVGVYLAKSIPAIVSILAVLKAGAAYVPLDPKAPATRIAYIIRNCGIRCLVTSSQKIASVVDMFTGESPLETIVLADTSPLPPNLEMPRLFLWQEVLETDKTFRQKNNIIETDLAYILYTSGSTGEPKGVMISHLNAFTFLKWVQSTFKIRVEDRLSNHAPLHFDLSILDIFGAFQAGATLVLVPDIISTFPVRLADWIEENRISIWYSVPSVLTMLVLHGELERHRFPALRTILFAGEVFPTKYLRRLMELIPHAEFYNLYGPTETNVITYYKVSNIPPEQTRPIPIGKACENMAVFALNDEGRVVSCPGEEGELYARGSCVAKGYWGDPVKTRKNFVNNPLQSNFPEIVYRTGDIVTLDEEGNYIYKGRRDHMIKSRGYRIELGEIETVLYSHSDVKEAAVIAIPDDLIGHRIYAYLVPHDGKKLSAADLRLFCGNRLPAYMIPEKFEFRRSLPKTSTGKIDKPTLLLEV